MIDDRAATGRVNFPIVVMSFLLAIILWAVVFTQEATDNRSIQIGLEYQGLDSTKFAFGGKVLSEYSVNIKAPAERLKLLANERENGVVDLRQAQAGTHLYTIGLPQNMREYAQPDPFPKVEVTLEPVGKIERNVRFGSSGKLSNPDIMLAHSDVSPHKVTITGPRSVLGRVYEARVTLDLSKVNPLVHQGYEGYIDLYDADGRQLPSDLGLKVSYPLATVTPYFASAPVQKVAFVLIVFKGQPNAGYTVTDYNSTPPTVSISGSSLTLAMLTQLQTEPVDLTGLTSSRQFFVNLVAPPGVTTVSPKRVKVRVEIRPQAKPVR